MTDSAQLQRLEFAVQWFAKPQAISGRLDFVQHFAEFVAGKYSVQLTERAAGFPLQFIDNAVELIEQCLPVIGGESSASHQGLHFIRGGFQHVLPSWFFLLPVVSARCGESC